MIIYANFEFKQGKTYEFGFTAKNNDTSTWIQPELSVNIDNLELNREKLQTANWKTISATFTAQSSQHQQLSIKSWWDKGGGIGNTPEGGNDYTIHDIYVIEV
ncbi:hypothetical protein AO263_24965 [Pseudomonas sp. NZIPFR-PS5]|nr:hypothetical protein AO263_24965 [Pseudomonas sp. NZIPFR-PS5]